MEGIQKTRKQRIEEQRKKKRKRIVCSAVVFSMTTFFIPPSGQGKACDCVSEYVVKEGDTLYSLASKYGVTVDQLKEKNQLESDLLLVGQTLHVPYVDEHGNLPFVGEEYTIQKGDTLWKIAKQFGTSVEWLQKENGLTSDQIVAGETLMIPQERIANKPAVYTVQPGDTLFSLAKRFHVSIDALKQENNLRHDIVYINQKLSIPSNNIVRQQATLVGAVDNTSLEFEIAGKPTVLEVSYGAAQSYQLLEGKTGWLTYITSQPNKRPALIHFQ